MSMNKAQLIGAMAGSTGLTKADSEKALKSCLQAIKDTLSGGGAVTLIGFGTFSVYERAARSGKNPRTGATIKIAAKKVAKFKPGKELSEMVASKTKKAAPKPAAKAPAKPAAKAPAKKAPAKKGKKK